MKREEVGASVWLITIIDRRHRHKGGPSLYKGGGCHCGPTGQRSTGRQHKGGKEGVHLHFNVTCFLNDWPISSKPLFIKQCQLQQLKPVLNKKRHFRTFSAFFLSPPWIFECFSEFVTITRMDEIHYVRPGKANTVHLCHALFHLATYVPFFYPFPYEIVFSPF